MENHIQIHKKWCKSGIAAGYDVVLLPLELQIQIFRTGQNFETDRDGGNKMKRGKRILAILLAAVMVTGLVGCGKKENPAESSTGTAEVSSTAAETVETTEAPETETETERETYVFEETAIELPENPIYKDPSYSTEERVADLMQYMTLEEKVAQMMQPELLASSAGEVTKYGIGSILSGGGAAPSTGNTPQDWYNAVQERQEAAMASRLGIPLLYGIDAVHGNNNVYGATIFPHNIGIGATGNVELAEQIAQITAEETHAIGVNWAFAPCVGNAQNEMWGRTYECFSEDAEVVTQFGVAYVKGLQDALENAYVAACAKHYIGEGYTYNGVNQGNVNMSMEEFAQLMEDEKLLEPYIAAIEAGVQTVMVSFNSVDGEKCHGNKWLLTDVLRGQLGFEGILISDYNGVQQIKTENGTYEEQILAALDAGIDMYMEPYAWKDCMEIMIDLVKDGLVSIDRINQSVERILTVKFNMGLFEHPYADEAELASIGAQEHRDVARQAVRESLVLLKNDMVDDENTVMEALAGYTDILVVGEGANDIGIQCGGWTISWTGSKGDITTGTTILEGIQEAVGDTKNITYSADASEVGDQQVAIVVLSEDPYCESYGDRNQSNLVFASKQTQMIDKIKEANPDMKIILLLISGRPVSIADRVDDADAIIAAWLPGSEGAGVADVLFGEYDFTGKLQFTWTWFAYKIANKHVDETTVLFPYGSGLTKSETIELPANPNL